MNNIQKKPVNTLGYHFIPAEFLPENKDEYYLRDLQNRSGINYRKLSAYEIEVLVRNRNTSDDWNKILVSDAFNPELVKSCKFYGLVRIGKLEPYYLEFNNIRMPVGLFNSTIISCDFGDNVVVDNVHYISHYIIGSEVMLINVNELATTDYAKFGNGILKEGEQEKNRIWLEICNENAGRSIIPFNGMLPGDAYLWSRFRDDEKLQSKLKAFTDNMFDKRRGYYGKVGDRTVIKNTHIIKDCWIGSDAYIKGANKLKNLTINSSGDAKTQIGEGVELVNGIIAHGCRIFYGVKAVRFIMASHSQLKYGARLINSYLGNNATISCCEVLNSLIFPAHEQHHNNSFLCAALILGQSNMAAGATIGSNHNSRGADGELIAGRGFWPGLCVSLKHNSKFASFTLLAKGDYPAELNVPIPFSLVVNDVKKDQLTIMPGYWPMYNMYALARNAWKYVDRDRRTEKIQEIEYDFLAPDSVNEIVESLRLLKQFTGMAWYTKEHGDKSATEEDCIAKGETLLESKDPPLQELEINAVGFENSNRKVQLIKVPACYDLFKRMLFYYAGNLLCRFIKSNKIRDLAALTEVMPAKLAIGDWSNIGGQLVRTADVQKLVKDIHTGKVKSWDDVHAFYKTQAAAYPLQKLLHALGAVQRVKTFNWKKQAGPALKELLLSSVETRQWMTERIFMSREKDYNNPFRQMTYESIAEMEKVIGPLNENSFILQEKRNLEEYKKTVKSIIRQFGL